MACRPGSLRSMPCSVLCVHGRHDRGKLMAAGVHAHRPQIGSHASSRLLVLLHQTPRSVGLDSNPDLSGTAQPGIVRGRRQGSEEGGQEQRAAEGCVHIDRVT